MKALPSDQALLNDFEYYASRNGVPARWYYINISSKLLTTQLKAVIGQYILGDEAFFPMLNEDDNNIETTIAENKEHKAEFPIYPQDENGKKSH